MGDYFLRCESPQWRNKTERSHDKWDNIDGAINHVINNRSKCYPQKDWSFNSSIDTNKEWHKDIPLCPEKDVRQPDWSCDPYEPDEIRVNKEIPYFPDEELYPSECLDLSKEEADPLDDDVFTETRRERPSRCEHTNKEFRHTNPESNQELVKTIVNQVLNYIDRSQDNRQYTTNNTQNHYYYYNDKFVYAKKEVPRPPQHTQPELPVPKTPQRITG
jgi:hypothetical protein